MARLDALQRAWPMTDASEIIGELSVLYFAMSKFNTHFPAIGTFLLTYHLPGTNGLSYSSCFVEGRKATGLNRSFRQPLLFDPMVFLFSLRLTLTTDTFVPRPFYSPP